MTIPNLSELDLYINDIVEELRSKYGYASRNRGNPYAKEESKRVVKFYYTIWIKSWWGIDPLFDEVIEIPSADRDWET